MRILAIETASRLGSVALVEKGRLVAASSLGGGKGGHSRWLIPAIERMLGDAGWPSASLDGIAVNRGPGSFTGIRIGIATAQGLALGWDRPVVGVHGLEALAWQVAAPAGEMGTDPATGPSPSTSAAVARPVVPEGAVVPREPDMPRVVISMVDARHGNVYGAAYGWGDHDRLPFPAEELVPPALFATEELLQAVGVAVREAGAVVALAGDGGVLYEPLARDMLGHSVRPVPLDGDRLRAETVARWAERHWVAGTAGPDGPDGATVLPLYLRKPEAERKWVNPAHP